MSFLSRQVQFHLVHVFSRFVDGTIGRLSFTGPLRNISARTAYPASNICKLALVRSFVGPVA